MMDNKNWPKSGFRPHDKNGKFASPDQKEREKKETANPDPAPTNFTPQVVTPETVPQPQPPDNPEPHVIEPSPDNKVVNGFIETPELLTAKNIRNKKFAQALFSGASLRQAHIIATGQEKPGSRTRGHELLRNPEVQMELRRLMEEKELGVKRAMDELDKGLKRGKIGSHADYLDKQLRILGMLKGSSDPAPEKGGVNLFQQLIIEAEKRGKEI